MRLKKTLIKSLSEYVINRSHSEHVRLNLAVSDKKLRQMFCEVL
jgi:hypothetical protein